MNLEYSESKNIRVVKRFIGNTFILGCNDNKSGNGDYTNDQYEQPEPYPRDPLPGEDVYIKESPSSQVGDKPCIKPIQVAFRFN
ncbi:MAG: hypothetical protein K0R14_2199 [Burkholderiales bacterium]|nr:hypothetical protein [Burkholderiales bacterium]